MSSAISGPEQTAIFHLMQLRSAIALDLVPGMRFSNRGNPTAHAIACGYTDFTELPRRITEKVKRQVHAQLNERIVAAGGIDRPLKS